MASIEKLIKLAKEHLDENEEIKHSIRGAYETKVLGSNTVRQGILLATNKRIVFFAKKLTGFDLEIFPYSKISSIEFSKGLMGHTISFFASNNKVKMKWIKGGGVKEFVESVRLSIENPKESSNTNTQDETAQQIQQLHDLKEKGILTDDEFQQKKKQLLGL
ncbi:MAG: PH domain-containing protein [Firmicutes bacterium]|nr:PH domain-containing protein [Bacillota bacterium]